MYAYQSTSDQKCYRSDARRRTTLGAKTSSSSCSSAGSISDDHLEGGPSSLRSGFNGSTVKHSTDSDTSPIRTPASWPLQGQAERSVLTFDEALSLVAEGALYFKAVSKPTHHAIGRETQVFGLLSLSNGQRILEASVATETLADYASFSLNECQSSAMPWNTLEQPSMALCFGRYVGTMTFSRYIGSMYRPAAQIDCSSRVLLRKIDLAQIFERLAFVQNVRDTPFVPTEQEEAFLYGQLLFDPLSDSNNGNIERDTAVLSLLLNTDIWIDFSDPQKQFVARYYADEAYDAPAELFFHQLLLSTELDRRISSHLYNSHGTEQSLATLPRKVAWAVALSRRFFQNLAYEELSSADSSSLCYHSLVPLNKIAQLERVLEVGYALEWPSMDQLEARMIVESESKALRCCWSAPSATFLCGTVLPGPAACWMVLSCLLDYNPAHRIILGGLETMHPQSGFQYRAHTYWYWESIVGKVLGAMQGSKCAAGWIGPCIFTEDLDPVQYVRTRLKQATKRMKKRDLRTIAGRSDPLGTLANSYPVNNFRVVLPDCNNIVDNVRVQKLALMTYNDPRKYRSTNMVEHKVAIHFTLDGSSYPMHLRYDVLFIAAAACWAGPHVLSYDYEFKAVRVDDLLEKIEEAGTAGERKVADSLAARDDDTVLVIEAFGVADNAVLARAW